MYVNKSEMARVFGISPTTVYARIAGIEAEIGKRYNRYAILDGLVAVEVFADYIKYRKRLNDKNLRKTVPPFSMEEARLYLMEEGYLHITCKRKTVSD